MQKIFFILCIAFIISFLSSSPALLTISLVSFFALAVYDGFFNKDFKTKWQNFISNKSYVAVTSIFVIIAYSGIYSELTPFYWDRVRVALPFLIVPFAFSSLPKLSERQYQLVLYFLLIAISIASFGTLANYLSDYAFYNKELGYGRPIPTPIHHIRFSLLIAFTITVGMWLFVKKVVYRYTWERWLILSLTGFLFIFIHILTVRSGIAVMYLTLFCLSLQYIFKTKRYILGGSVVLMIMAAPFLAYQLVPSFKNRIAYAIYDFQNMQNGNVKNFSDGERMISYEAGFQVGNQSPWFGVGIGNLNKEISQFYAKKYPELIVKRPHNQFIFFYAAIGIIGTIGFLLAFFLPFFHNYNFKDELILAFYIIMFLSFMVETTIGSAIGIAYYIFLLLLLVKHKV
ncbi:MAG: O-antigen ligase family protein [Saprospiraceae bacterium]